MVMFKIQKLLQPFILSGVLCIGQYARAEEDVSRFVTIIDGASNPAAAPAAPTASPPTDAPTSTAKSSNSSIESGQNPPVSSTERLQSEPIISPSTPPKSVNSANLEVVLLKTDRKSTRLNSSHLGISYALFCLQ